MEKVVMRSIVFCVIWILVFKYNCVYISYVAIVGGLT